MIEARLRVRVHWAPLPPLGSLRLSSIVLVPEPVPVPEVATDPSLFLFLVVVVGCETAPGNADLLSHPAGGRVFGQTR